MLCGEEGGSEGGREGREGEWSVCYVIYHSKFLLVFEVRTWRGVLLLVILEKGGGRV
jgi:hypothetical protein